VLNVSQLGALSGLMFGPPTKHGLIPRYYTFFAHGGSIHKPASANSALASVLQHASCGCAAARRFQSNSNV
jgi:hypothetical protein